MFISSGSFDGIVSKNLKDPYLHHQKHEYPKPTSVASSTSSKLTLLPALRPPLRLVRGVQIFVLFVRGVFRAGDPRELAVMCSGNVSTCTQEGYLVQSIKLLLSATSRYNLRQHKCSLESYRSAFASIACELIVHLLSAPSYQKATRSQKRA